MNSHVISVADCRRQGVGLYWQWRQHQRSTSNFRPGPPPRTPRDVITPADDVTRRHRKSRELDGWITDRGPHRRRVQQRLDPLFQDARSPGLPRQRRRRHKAEVTLQTSVDATPRDLYASRAALGDVITPRDPVTSSFCLLTPVPTGRANDGLLWSKSEDDWCMLGLLESPGRMSCIQLQLVEEEHTISAVQVTHFTQVSK